MEASGTGKRCYGEFKVERIRTKNGYTHVLAGPGIDGARIRFQCSDLKIIDEKRKEAELAYTAHLEAKAELGALVKEVGTQDALAALKTYKASGNRHSMASCVAAGAKSLKENEHTVEVAVNEYYDRINSRTRKMTKDSFRRLKQGLERFREHFGSTHVDAVSCSMIESFLRSARMKLSGAPLTTSEHDKIVEAISAFFNSAVRRGEAKRNPAAGIEKKHDKAVRKNAAEIVMPNVLECLLRDLETYTGCTPNAPKEPGFLIPMVILEVMGGVRPGVEDGEISKLRVSDIVLERGYIRIKADVSKNRKERVIMIRDNMYRWLVRYLPKEPDAYLLPANAKSEMDLLRRKYGIPHDGFRHTFVTGLFGLLGDLELVAEEAGSCASTLELHYLNRELAEECSRIFSIYPSGYEPKTIYIEPVPDLKSLILAGQEASASRLSQPNKPKRWKLDTIGKRQATRRVGRTSAA